MASTPDVRIRLSAEGVAEVVAALKKIQSESDKAAVKQSRSFQGVNSVLRSTTRLLGALGLAVSAVSFANLIRGGARTAEELGKLSEKVGASVEHLSALNLAASESDIEINQLAQSMALLNKKIAEAQEGNTQAIATFTDLGIAVESFDGLDAAQALDLVARKLNEIEPGFRKSKLAMDLFGKSGSRMIPLLNQLAEEGLGGLEERARKLGVLLDQETVDAVRRLEDGMKRLKVQAEVAGANFFAGFSEPVTKALKIISGEVTESGNVWRKLGEVVGAVALFMVTVVTAAAEAIKSTVAQVGTSVKILGQVMGALAQRDFATAVTAYVVGNQEIAKRNLELDESMKKLLKTIMTPIPKPKTSAGGGPEDEDPSELIQKRSNAAKAVLDKELQLFKLQAKFRGDADKRAFERGLIDIQEFYRRRREIAIQETDKEISALLKKRALLESELDPEKRAGETAKIDVELQAVRLERENELANITLDEIKDVRTLGQERLTIEQEILEATGRQHDAAMLGIDERIRQYDVLLRKQKVGDEERIAQLERLRVALTNTANFEETQRVASLAMDELARARERIQAEVDAGLISQFQGETQILALERERLGVLQQLAAVNLAAAQATGDPEKIAQAQALADSLTNMAIATNAASSSMQRFQESFEGAAVDAITNFFDQGIVGAKVFKEGVLGAIAAIAASLKRLASEEIALRIFSGIKSLTFSGGGKVQAKAAGGPIKGPGTGTSDSIVARVSRGEFIIRAAVVQQPGVLKHLEELNRMGVKAMTPRVTVVRHELPAFAIGGLVGGGGGVGAGGVPREGRLQIGLEDGLVAKILESPEGQRITVQNLGKNRRAARHALGG